MLNQKGQSLIEYLIIVALIAVGSIAVMRTLGQTVAVQFSNIANALQGKDTQIQATSIQSQDYKRKALDDFFKGAANGSSDH